MPNLGTPELILIIVIILLLFGAKKLPELSRTIGSSIKELRGSLTSDGKKEDDDKKAGK
jgi:sec-independent protein translocase protein TatA